MSLVPAKCTQCGGNIEVDDTHEAGICKFCGTPFVTEKAINNYNTYVTNNNNFAGANINVVGGNIANLLELAKNALEINNEKDVLKYCEKALEIDVKNSDAWFIKMKGEKSRVAKSGISVATAKSIEAISVAGNNSIKYSNDINKQSRTDEVYNFYLDSVLSLLKSLEVAVEYDNIEVITALSNTNPEVALAKDQMFILGLTTQGIITIGLLDNISNEMFLTNKLFQDKLIECINLYVSYRKKYKTRTLNYSDGPNNEAVASMKSEYNRMVEKLPEGRRNEVKPWTITGCSNNTSNSSSKSNGCYIATCVYGSYDCPQVWTLRRFRDYTLDKTWYGRLFIKLYYAISPTLVKFFGRTDWFKSLWKKPLDKMVTYLKDRGVADTQYKDKY